MPRILTRFLPTLDCLEGRRVPSGLTLLESAGEQPDAPPIPLVDPVAIVGPGIDPIPTVIVYTPPLIAPTVEAIPIVVAEPVRAASEGNILERAGDSDPFGDAVEEAGGAVLDALDAVWDGIAGWVRGIPALLLDSWDANPDGPTALPRSTTHPVAPMPAPAPQIPGQADLDEPSYGTIEGLA